MQHLIIKHLLDALRKDLYENILRTLMGETGYIRTREDIKEMGIREEVWLHSTPNNPGHYEKPHATYVLTPTEK